MISIVMPVYNVKKYLSRAVDSVLSQTYTELELVLVDDGSTDGSGELCDSYADKDSRVRVIHQANAGLSGARNSGIAEARGEYICLPDSDDFVELDMLEILANHIEKSSSDLFIWGYFVDYEDDNGIYSSSRIDCPDAVVTATKNPLKTVPSFVGYAWNKLYKKSIIEKNKLKFKQGISLVEDVLFNKEYIEKCESITFVDRCFNHYMQHGNQTLGMKYYPDAFELKKSAFEAWSEIVRLMHFDKDVAEKFINSQRCAAVMFYPRMTVRANGLSDEDKRELIKAYLSRADVQLMARECSPVGFKKKLITALIKLKSVKLLTAVLK